MTVAELIQWCEGKPSHAEIRVGSSIIMIADKRFKPVKVKNQGNYSRVKEWRKNNPEKDIERCAREFFRNKGMDPKDIPEDLLKMKCEQIKLNRKVKSV